MTRRKSELDTALDTMFDVELPETSKRTLAGIHRNLGGAVEGSQSWVSIDRLDADPNQPRRRFTPETLHELAESIKAHGVLEPLLVRKSVDGRYLIVAGERRFRAARLAGVSTIPCRHLEMDDQQALVIALTENVHRDDLDPVEKCEALVRLKTLLREQGLPATWKEVAALVRLSEQRVKNLSRYEKLADPVKELIHVGQLSGYQVEPLLGLDPADQITVAQQAAVNTWSREQVQTSVSRLSRRPPRKRQEQGAAPHESTVDGTFSTSGVTPTSGATDPPSEAARFLEERPGTDVTSVYRGPAEVIAFLAAGTELLTLYRREPIQLQPELRDRLRDLLVDLREYLGDGPAA